MPATGAGNRHQALRTLRNLGIENSGVVRYYPAQRAILYLTGEKPHLKARTLWLADVNGRQCVLRDNPGFTAYPTL